MEDEVVFFLFFFCQRGRALCEKYCDVNCCQHVLPSPSSHCCRLSPSATLLNIFSSRRLMYESLWRCVQYIYLFCLSRVFWIHFAKQACRFMWTVGLTDPFTTLIKMCTFSLLMRVMCCISIAELKLPFFPPTFLPCLCHCSHSFLLQDDTSAWA